jgi:CMP-N,N'-diacetyllegionaminic acid synthase
MGESMKRLCTICARGGSKSIPNKNLRPLHGKPLIAHSLIQAKKSGLFEAIAVSSDSKEILDIAREWGANFLITRPAHLATDQAPKIPSVQHCVKEVEGKKGWVYDTVCDLDPTAPLRTLEDIKEAVKLLEKKKVSNVITGAPARKSPYFNLVEVDNKGVVRLSKETHVPIGRRQDSPRCFDLNASIYVWKRDSLFERESVFFDDTLMYEMPPERSIDIDRELDFEIVDFLGRKNKLL